MKKNKHLQGYVGAPLGNLNAEKWPLEVAEKFMDKAMAISEQGDYDFIGEVAKDAGGSKIQFYTLIAKFPHLQAKFERIKNNCEVNCFRDTKNNKINTAAGIINLKSNHKWTDRIDTTSNDEKITPVTNILNIAENELSRTLLERLAEK